MVIINFDLESLNLFFRDSEENPANINEWVAPILEHDSIANIASGIKGMYILTVFPLIIPSDDITCENLLT